MSGNPSSRRQFLRRAALGAAGLALGGAAPAQPAPGSDVVVVRHPGMVTRRTTDEAKVREAVDCAVCELTGAEEVAEAWRQIVTPEDVVGIKVNCSGGPSCHTSLAMVRAAVAGMAAAGMPEDNIIVCDQTERALKVCGYPVRRRGEGFRCEGLEEYDRVPMRIGQVYTRFAKVYSQEITALVNMPMLKTSMAAEWSPGVTMALKNNFGAISNPDRFHHNQCEPYISLINSAKVIRDKTRLILGDGTRPLYDGGPMDNPRARASYGAVLASFDPVAHDNVGHQILMELRKQERIRPQPVHLRNAGMPPYNLGVWLPAHINRRDIVLE
ncbi:MAG: DUF362 domain-containing protein [Armatimonadota bacterium]